jgi:hypothetical protein
MTSSGGQGSKSFLGRPVLRAAVVIGVLSLVAVHPALAAPAFLGINDSSGAAVIVLQRTPSELASPFVVLVQNTGESPVNITLSLVGLSNSDDKPMLPSTLKAVSDSKPLPSRQKAVKPGSIVKFVVNFVATNLSAGTYAGSLVATSSDGGNVQASLQLVVTSGTEALDPVRGLDPASTTALTRSVASQWFSPLTSSASIAIPLVGSASGDPTQPSIVGELANDREQFASVVRRGSKLIISDIVPSSKYAGTVDLVRGLDQGAVTLTIQNRDYPWIPLLVLALGVLGSIAMGWWVKSRRGRDRQRTLLTKAKEAALKLQAARRVPTPGGGPAPEGGYVITSDRQDALLDAEIAKAEMELSEAETDAERAKWAASGPEVGRITGYVDSLSKLYDAADGIKAHLSAFSSFFDHEKHFDVHFDKLAMVVQVKAALEGRIIRTPRELEALQSDLKSAGDFLDSFREVYETIVRLEAAVPRDDPDGLGGKVEHLHRAMLGPEFDTVDLVGPLKEDVAQLALAIAASKVPSADASSFVVGRVMAAQTVEESDEVIRLVQENVGPLTLSEISALFPNLATTGPQLASLEGVLRELVPAPRQEASSSELLLRLRRRDLYFNVVTFGLVVTSGMILVYATNATFGSWADYMAILLWGFGIDVGIKLLRQFSPAFIGRLSGV